MIKHYLKSAIRSVLKNRFFAIISIFCLSIGISGIYVAYLLLLHINGPVVDRNRKDCIYILNNHYNFTDKALTGKHLPGSIIPMMLQQYPAIESAARVAPIENIIVQNSFKDAHVRALGCYSENSLFYIFNNKPGLAVTNEYLNNPESIVLSKKLAKKLFGNDNALQQSVIINNRIYNVTSVFDNISLGFGIQFDFVIPLQNYLVSNPEVMTSNTFLSYVLLRSPQDFQSLSSQIGKQSFNDAYLKTDVHFTLEPFNKVSQAIEETGLLLSIAALILMIVTVINFVNLTNTRLSLRNKEIGLRKVNGASRSQVFVQYISETLILTFLAATIAVILTILFLPQINLIFSPFSNVEISFGILNPETLLYLILGLIATGVLSGIYPAAILASFRPVQILQSRFNSPVRGIFVRRFFVLFQYTPAVFVILFSLTLFFRFQDQFLLRSKSLPENVYLFELNESNVTPEIQKELSNLPQIKSIATSSVLPTEFKENAVFSTEQNYTGIVVPGTFITVNNAFISLFNINLLNGSVPSENENNRIIINKSLAERLKTKGDLPERLIINQKIFYIAGVFDFPKVTEDFKNPLPVVINISKQPQSFCFIKSSLTRNEMLSTLNYKLNKSGDITINLQKLKDYQNRAEQFNLQVSRVIIWFSILMLFIAAMGILSLSSLLAVRKTRENGIRKVYGATSINIFRQFSKEFFFLVFISLFFGTLLAFLVIDLIQKNDFRLQFKTIAITFTVLIITTIMAFIYQSISAAFKNPIEALKHD